ncbi:Hsp20/alpha crystallin family protein [Dinoroseobacter sp. PD6]|uniref:Hsp20/alpha crystallin family protein n=1 Tax=Dinoroseobacter sp. PD6 TaxID=3028384 RepID=UPI00237C264B|nr:Hsp20/alpha crystallin family protein [Dinoroseobacter sp. PD6]MDD9717029.1 Hsp20/alpha crystallin family protein [Dinoroseobacter sp. PD6]
MVEKSHATGFWPSLADPFRTMGSKLAEWVAPASEASVKDTAYTIRMELPGVAEDDVELSVHDGVVTVKGEKKSEREESGETWYFSERQYGSFSRSFRLPPDADEEAVAAEMKDGVLTVSVGKKSPEKTGGTRKIPISRG